MNRRGRLAVCALIAIGFIGACGAALRWNRFRGAAAHSVAARAALDSLQNPAPRLDLAAHLDYLDARLAKGWLYRKRDMFLGELYREAQGIRDAAEGRIEALHLRPGHHVIVTVSRVDGAPLPTSVCVPEAWDGRDPLPLMLVLHAGGVREMIQCFPVKGHPRALCAMPLARGSHDYLGVQMTAVEECVADIRSRYPVSRVYVLGSSQGGMGSWLFAERHASDVAGLSPWSSNADPAAWEGLWEPAGGEPRSGAGRACAQVRVARSPIARAEQIAADPPPIVYAGHGTVDRIIPIGHAESMVARLRSLGLTVRFDRFDGYGHRNIPSRFVERIDVLLVREPPGPARSLRVVIPPLTFVAELAGGPAHRVIDPARPARFVLRDGRIEGAENVEAVADGKRGKWAYPGPAGRAFESAFRVALPRDPPPHLAACAAAFTAHWQARFGTRPLLSDAADGFSTFGSDGARPRVRTLVALGSPDENPAVRAALQGLDVSVGRRVVRLFGGEYEGRDVGLILLLAHPSDARAGTLVIWGSTPDSYRQLWTRFGQLVDWEGDRGRWWFDYAVFDRRTCGPDSFLAAGFLDHDWKYTPELRFEGSEALRAKMPGRHWPAVVPSGDPAWLSSLAPSAIESVRGPVGFDRSAGVDAGALSIAGQTFEHGIGMAPPARASWNLDGRFARLTVMVGLQRTDQRYPVRARAERIRFEVRGDGRLLAWSPVMAAGDGPQELTADLTGVKVLELRAEGATTHVWHFGPVGWGDARLRASP